MPLNLESLVAEIINSRKYRGLGIPPETVRDLLLHELDRGVSLKDALKETRRKLHNVVASYLGEPDYPHALDLLNTAYQSGDVREVKAACSQIMSAHASTKERLVILDEFYPRLWSLTGKPAVLLDLACGLNPLSFTWMGLERACQYFAYDLNQKRIDFINACFRLQGLTQPGVAGDVLLNPPQLRADTALLFKEAHRFEQRQRGCNLPFWQTLNVRWLLVSLPTSSLSGKHDLVEKHRKLVDGICHAQPWQVTEVLFANEIVFCVDKGEH